MTISLNTVICWQGDRIGFGVTLTLALCVNLMIVTEFIPETSKTIPEVCNYFLCNMFLSSASIAMATFSINLHLWIEKRQLRLEISQRKPLDGRSNQQNRPSQDLANNNFTEVVEDQNNRRKVNKTKNNVCLIEAQGAELEGCKRKQSKLMVQVDIAVAILYFIGTTTYSVLFFRKIYYNWKLKFLFLHRMITKVIGYH